ncbi:IS3 family transposase [Pontibacillus sp. HMF3514]|uniref:IS3 family transposase n=1 Tax=Pontibacillus sp. HMF3514 TaxID=2692425 RepID=UPI001917286E|nr:IS3 family transposase [Pontibacillus sp. HMF3514]
MGRRKRYTSEFKSKIVLEILKEEKSISEISSEHGIHVNQLRQWRKAALEQMPQIFETNNKKVDQMKEEYENQIENLYAEVGRLTTQLSWLKKKNLALKTRAERVSMIDWEGSDLSIKAQAELLSLNRTSLYYKPVEPSPEELMIKHKIDEIYTKYPFFGSRRIKEFLKNEKIFVNRKTVQGHMREMGIAGISPGPNLSKRNQQHRIYPYLLRGLAITHPNHVWGIDITYIRLEKNWMYLVAIIDWYSRYVISWELDQTLEMDFVLETVNRALSNHQPIILNSDQGSHFTSPQYTDLLKENDIKISMDGKGRALDNIITERLWRTVKYEEVYLKDYTSPREARNEINSFLHFYNQERPHQSLGYQPPATVFSQS